MDPAIAVDEFAPNARLWNYDGTLPGETELGSAGVQPNKG
jgi:hypothetical protein